MAPPPADAAAARAARRGRDRAAADGHARRSRSRSPTSGDIRLQAGARRRRADGRRLLLRERLPRCVAGAEPERVYAEQVIGGDGVDVALRRRTLRFPGDVIGASSTAASRSARRHHLEAIGEEGSLFLADPWHGRSAGIELRREDGVRADRDRRRRPVHPRARGLRARGARRGAAAAGQRRRARRRRASIEALYASRRHFDDERTDVKTSLGIWALGAMVTRFVPGGYQPEHGRETHGREGAARGRRARRPDRRLRVPLPAGAQRATTSTRSARRSAATASTASPAACTSTRASARAGSPRPTPACATRRGGSPARPPTSPASSARTSSSGPGSRATTTRSRRPTRELALAHRGHRRGRRGLRGARRQALPRAQELRARDEDPHGQHRDDAARHPQAARPGDRQRPGQHGLAAPDHERRAPRRVRRAAGRRGAARPPARATPAGARSTTTTWSARRRSWRRSSWPLELRRADYGASGERLGFDLYPYTEDQVGGGAALGRAVALHRRRRGAHRRAALREAQSRKDAVRAYELVYAALGARPRERRGRARRRHDRGSRRSRSPRTARSSARAEAATRSRRRGPGWAEQDPEDWWRGARRRRSSELGARRRRRHRAVGPDARARRARRRRAGRCARRSSGTTSAPRPSARRSRSAIGPRAADRG